MRRHEHVLVLYNEPVLPVGHPDSLSEHEVLDNVVAVQEVLTAAGFTVSQLGISHDPAPLVAGLTAPRPDVVVNLFEGTADRNITEAYVAGVLEWLRIPFTGCPFRTIFLAQNKHLTKHLFHGEGLPTAPFFVANDSNVEACPLRFPVIVKPAQQDSSLGVEQASVVTDLASLKRRIAHCIEDFGAPALVEEFIFGRELTVALVETPELRMLPITEAVFPENVPGYWPILSYDAKWSEGSSEYETTDYHFHAELTPALAEKLELISRKAFRLLGARDYARLDYRVRGDELFLLELNPNPDFAPDRGLSNNLWAAGSSHAEFTVQIVENALARGQDNTTPRYQLHEAS